MVRLPAMLGRRQAPASRVSSVRDELVATDGHTPVGPVGSMAMGTQLSGLAVRRAGPGSSLIADATFPIATAIAKARSVPRGLTPSASATPAPTIGIDIPTKPARNSPLSASARLSGRAMRMTVPTAPLKIAPAPAPITAPPIMNNVRLGVGSHTAVTVTARPSSISAMPARSPRRTDHPAVASCATTPAQKTPNTVAPARACEGWCSATSRKWPDKPVNSPNAAKTVNALSAAA